MEGQTRSESRISARVPKQLEQKFQELIQNGYKPSEILREGIRESYRKMTISPQEITA